MILRLKLALSIAVSGLSLLSPIASAETRILILGTSIACGQGASRPEVTWPALVEDAIKQGDPATVSWNLCLGGAHSLTMWGLLSERGFSWRPNLIIMEAGALDEFYLEVEGQALSAIAAAADAKGIRLIFMHPYTWRRGHDSYADIRKAADRFGFAVADVEDRAIQRKIQLTDVTIDGMHPNDNGHRLIAETVMEAIRQWQPGKRTPSTLGSRDLRSVSFIPAATAIAGARSSLQPGGAFARSGRIVIPAGRSKLSGTVAGTALSILFDGRKGPSLIEFSVDNGPWITCASQPDWFPHYVLKTSMADRTHHFRLRIESISELTLEGLICAR